ncbi:Thymidylate synthase ThyX [uncultured archaeon]|nr:Thymidylate synthase ThyX [uncultured archaeon]
MHTTIKEAEKILDKKFPVLNHGFVRLVDYMGGDSAIVQAARVSYGMGTKTVSEDNGLIRYLMRHEHTSPFEMVEMKFHCKMPIFVARQWVRHRTASLNEISGRYSVMKDEFYIPEAEQVNLQSKNNKQGRSEETFSSEETEKFLLDLEYEQQKDYSNYKKRIEIGMARELARINLPLSLYTEWYWKIDLHNLFHFLGLRMDEHAQYEIRAYAETMFEMTKKVAPLACQAFEDYQLNAMKFSASEITSLKRLLKGDEEEPILDNPSFVSKGKVNGEGTEFMDKLTKMSRSNS